jgi:hypothetical protein
VDRSDDSGRRRALTRRGVLVVAALVAALAPVPTAHAARPILGVLGGIDRFQAQTGQRSRAGHVILGFGQLPTRPLLARLGEMPLLGFDMGGPGRRSITPRQVALGRGDDFLFALNAVAAAWSGPIYFRPYAEMNGHWNSYCAFTSSGRAKGSSHSTGSFRKAFARTYLLLHGGPRDRINARLRLLGLPGIARDLPENPMPRVRVIWNPQGYGSPDLPGNSAEAYYAGDRYVDVVGNDLYYIGGKAEWAANERLYAAHPSKPYAFPEWGLWGLDAPSFVAQMAAFVRTHRRVELVSWFNGKRGSMWDLGSKPRSRAAYRRLIVPLGRAVGTPWPG